MWSLFWLFMFQKTNWKRILWIKNKPSIVKFWGNNNLKIIIPNEIILLIEKYFIINNITQKYIDIKNKIKIQAHEIGYIYKIVHIIIIMINL